MKNGNEEFYKNGRRPFRKYQKLGLPGLLAVLGIMLLVYFFSGNDEDVIHTNDRHVVNSFEKYEVKLDRHTDGDTTQFIFNGESHSFRYLIIDTPEIGRNGDKSEPYAEEALERVKEVLGNAEHIYIEFDNEIKDKYDRYLAYVYADDVMLNELLVREGLATVRYIQQPNDTYLDILKKAEKEAKANKRGLWSN
ncbi:thermonuclease family protein [Phocicoccus pinnipedialis]|uniref:Thermonuclease n=1 Tax=Phocicoccus pinnipedialis TaxID=110845 RepID=A0A6V7RB94_9BACL|nr:thermonuclease family protein [Jeotgalicoccus pinnipedialis]MBP1939584.1 micrococcal nuclease [Jeotgalicoccus pinnipedialis]CAD2074903.1 Thermonuclease precursor [Jeotgalicoccus pinnipedialis]